MKVSNIFVGLLVSIIVGSSGAQARMDLPGTTITDHQLRQDILMPLYGAVISSMDCKSCKEFGLKNVTNTVLIGTSHDGSWKEIWTVEACGKKKDFEITFTSSPLGGTDFAIKVQ